MPLANLNPQQKQAVTTTDGPVMIVAGAGTGKTTVLTEKIAYLIEQDLAKANEILALTFTDQAAGEMEERVDRMLPYGYVDLWIMTFHSFCDKILSEHAIEIGLPGDYQLINETQQWLLVRENLDRFELDYYRPLGNSTKFIKDLLRHFSRCKDEAIFPEDYLEHADRVKIDLDQMESGAREEGEMEIQRLQEVAGAYHTYQQLLLENSYLDFGDLINYTLRLFKIRPQILKKYQQQFKYFLVDEFQDTNWVQYDLVKLLVGDQQNLTVVGDDDQSIYKFRGASVSNILQFKQDFPKSQEIYLTENYRSTQDILDLAYNFIQLNNPERLEYRLAESSDNKNLSKKLKANLDATGHIELITSQTYLDEVEAVTAKIIELLKEDPEATFNDFVILIRSNSQAENFLVGLKNANITTTYVASKGLYTKEVILDTFAYLKLLDDYHESSAFWRILNLPIFDLPPEELLQLTRFSHRKNLSLFQTAKQVAHIDGVTDNTKRVLDKILKLIGNHEQLTKKEGLKKVVLAFFKDFGYYEYLLDQNDTTSFSYLNKLFKKIDDFASKFEDASIKNFIHLIEMEKEAGETGDLDKDFDEGPESVKVMTVHSAKGLEFKYVFVVNLATPKFPSRSRSESIAIPDELVKEIIPDGDIHLQEERRLFYVALTRAKQGLYLTHALNYGKKRNAKPSVFLYETQLLKEEVKNKKKTVDKTKAETELAKEFNPAKISVAETKNNIEKFKLPKAFSFSQLKAYETCPYQYYLNFILKIPTEGKGPFSFGRSMHNTLQDFFELIRQEDRQEGLFVAPKSEVKLPPEKQLLEFYEHNWQDDWFDSKDEENKYRTLGEKSLHNIYAELKQDLPETIALEKDFNFKLSDYTIKGKIDRVDKLPNGKVEIIDYKTGTPKDKLSTNDKDQLLLYQMAAEEVLGWQVERLTFYYLNNNTRISFVGSDKEIDTKKEKFLTLIKSVLTTDFEAIPSEFTCKYCDFRNICSYRK